MSRIPRSPHDRTVLGGAFKRVAASPEVIHFSAIWSVCHTGHCGKTGKSGKSGNSCAIVKTMSSKREPSTLGAIAVPSGLALVDGIMTIGAVAGPVGLLAAGGAVAGTGAVAAAAKRAKAKKAAAKTVAGSARKTPSLKSPKASKGSGSAGKSGGKSGGKAAGSRKGSLGKLAAAGKGGKKPAAAGKASKGLGKRGSMLGTGSRAGKAKSGGKSGFGSAGKKAAKAGKGLGGFGSARLVPKKSAAKRAGGAVRKGAKRAAKSKLLGKRIMALAATARFWRDRKPKPKPKTVVDAVEKRMRAMAKKPAKPAFAEPIQVALPPEPEAVALPSLAAPVRPEKKGTTVSQHQFVGAVEAIDAAFAGFDPENARSLERYLAGTAEVAAAFARGLNTGGVRISEDFLLDKGAGEYITNLGLHMAQVQTQIEEATQAFRSAHAEQLERINSGDARHAKWDYSANQE